MLLGVVLLGLLVPRFQWIAGFPDEFFNPPPGPASLFSGFPPRSFFVGVDTVLITATVFLIAGRDVTVASTAITSALLTGNTWAFRAAAFRALCGLGCLFHVVVGHMMHITFVSNLPAYAAFADWEDLAVRAGVLAPIERLQRWLLGCRAWHLLAVSAALTFVYLRWGNAVQLTTTMVGPDNRLLPRMVALWIAAGLALVLVVFRLSRRT